MPPTPELQSINILVFKEPLTSIHRSCALEWETRLPDMKTVPATSREDIMVAMTEGQEANKANSPYDPDPFEVVQI